jgi:hypothetical protein
MQEQSCARKRSQPAVRKRRCLLKGCDQHFHPQQARQRYCSEECRTAARRWSRWKAQERYRATPAGQGKRNQRSLGGKAAPVLDGFTGDQRFFIAFARLWGTKYREEAMRLQLNTNNHPLAQWRAIATLQNMLEFHRAFQCKPGDPMVRAAVQQCRLW